MERYRCTICGYLAPLGEQCPKCEGRAALQGSFPVPDPRAGWIKNFTFGVQYFLTGFKFIKKNPSLTKYIIIPLIISILLFIGLVISGFYCIDPMLSFLDNEWISILDWLRSIVKWIFLALSYVLVVLMSLLLTFILSTVINSPFFEILSEKVEEAYLGRVFDEKWSWDYIVRTILVPLKESIKLAIWQLIITTAIFILSLISAGLGTVLFAVAGPYFASMAIFDFVMARKTYHLVEKRKFLRTNIAFIMGFGTPVYFLPFLTPFAVVGATLGFLSARNK